jgi:DNA-directed RNA polymerase specialized sigma24 family protein
MTLFSDVERANLQRQVARHGDRAILAMNAVVADAINGVYLACIEQQLDPLHAAQQMALVLARYEGLMLDKLGSAATNITQETLRKAL